MIRNTPEYMLDDGSPRYGIRTGEPAEATVPVSQGVDISRLLQAAAELDGAELKLAAQHRFVLDRFKGDAALIKALRKAFPVETKEAEAAVRGRLGSPDTWMRGARKAYNKAVSDEAERNGTLFGRGAAALASLGLSLVIMATLLGLIISRAPALPALMIVLALLAVTKPIQRRLRRTIDHGSLPARVSSDDGAAFWDDVVNATLLAVLANKGLIVDQATAAAAGRGWQHTLYASGLAQELRTNVSGS